MGYAGPGRARDPGQGQLPCRMGQPPDLWPRGMEHGRTQAGPSTEGAGHPHQGHLQAAADVGHQQHVPGRAQPQG
eukprot:13110996-Alexandrium_andersonii.AAC.1